MPVPQERENGGVPAGVPAGAARALALQATLGNRSVARILAREPAAAPAEPAAPTAVPTLADWLAEEREDTAAKLRAGTLESERLAGATRGQQLLIERMRTLGADEASILEQGAELEGMKDAEKKHAAAQAALSKQFSKAVADHKMVTEPGTNPAALNEMLARRGVASATPTTTTSTPDPYAGWRFTEKGWVKGSSTTTTAVVDGTAGSLTQASSTTVDQSSVTKTTSTTTSMTKGEKTETATSSTSSKFSVADGDPSYTRTKTDSATTKVGEDVSSSSSSTSTKFGLSGASRTNEEVTKVGDAQGKTSSTFGVTRGDGQVGATSSKSSSFGQVDEEGKLVKGVEKKTDVKGGVIAGPDGVGAFGGVSQDVTQTHAKGVKTGISAGLDGRFVVNVKELKDKDPVQYQLVLTVNCSAKFGLSGSAEKESEAKDSASVSASGNVSAGATATFVHTLSADEAKEYLADLSAAAGGASSGKHPEIAIVATIKRDGVDAARAALQSLRGTLGSADGAKGIPEGDSVELGATGKAEGKLGVGTKSGGAFGGSIEAGASTSGSIKIRLSKKAGKIILFLEVAGESGWSAGGSASYGVASMGGGYAETAGKGQSVAFTLDPSSGQYNDQYRDISAAMTVDDVKNLMAKYPGLVGVHTESESAGDTTTVKAGVAGVNLEMASGAKRDKSVTTDEKGQKTHTFTGTNTLGGSVSVAGLKHASSKAESITVTVGPDNTAQGDTSITTKETDIGQSVSNLGKAITSDPIGLVTGGAKIAAEKTDVQGMKLSDDDFAAIAARAEDPKVWQKPLRSPRHIADWEACRKRIAAAGGDRVKIAAAISDFVGTEGHGRQEMVEGIVRRPYTGAGGVRYEWPDGLAGNKEAFDSLVMSDPVASSRSLAKDGKTKEALDDVNAQIAKLDKVQKALEDNRGKFEDPTALAEMISALAAPATALRSQHRTLTRALTPPVPGKPPPPPPIPEGVAYVPTAEQVAAQQEELKNRGHDEYEAAIRNCAEYKKNETTIMVELDKEYDHWYRKADIVFVVTRVNKLKEMYVTWEQKIKMAHDLAAKWGFPSPSLMIPDRGKYDHYYKKSTSG